MSFFGLLKDRIKSNKILYPMVKLIRRVQYYCIDTVLYKFEMHARRLTGISMSENDIRGFKNKHNGQRCFIIATGPSLTMEDLALLRNEVTFGMNSLCRVFANIGWETTYYGIQDQEVYRILENDVMNLRNSHVLAAKYLKRNFKLRKDFTVFPLDFMGHYAPFKIPYYTSFSDDAYTTVYDGYTIAYSLVQLAVYMGFTEIYLLGADCSYPADLSKRNFVNIGRIDPTYDSARDRILFSYSIAKKYTEERGVKIFNATRGGALELFPRVQLEEIDGIGR